MGDSSASVAYRNGTEWLKKAGREMYSRVGADPNKVATAAEIPANLPMRLPGRKYDRQFFFAMTVLLAAVVAIGFAPTYYLAGLLRAPFKHTQPMLPRMFFFSCWPRMTCGPRARFIARRSGAAPF
jgi:hypothetical protein